MELGQFYSFTFPLKDIVALTFLIITGAYTIFTAILYYHWKSYSSDPKVTGLTLVVYFSSTLPLLIAMGVMAIIIL